MASAGGGIRPKRMERVGYDVGGEGCHRLRTWHKDSREQHNNQIEVIGGRKIRHDGGGGRQQRNNQILNRRVGRKIAEAVDGKKGVSSGDDHQGQQRGRWHIMQ